MEGGRPLGLWVGLLSRVGCTAVLVVVVVWLAGLLSSLAVFVLRGAGPLGLVAGLLNRLAVVEMDVCGGHCCWEVAGQTVLAVWVQHCLGVAAQTVSAEQVGHCC